MTNMRFHLIALSCIIVLVLVVFSVTGQFSPKAPATTIVEEEVAAPTGPLIITVWEASWGLNCNPSKSSYNRKPGNDRHAPPALKEIQPNNALDKVKALCDGKERCEFTADSTTLGGAKSIMGCRPDLELTYRCFDFDRPWNLYIRNGGSVAINCKKS